MSVFSIVFAFAFVGMVMEWVGKLGLGNWIGFMDCWNWIHGMEYGMGMDGQSRVRVELKLNTEYKICSEVKCMTVYVYNHGEHKNIEQAMGMMPIDRFILF